MRPLVGESTEDDARWCLDRYVVRQEGDGILAGDEGEGLGHAFAIFDEARLEARSTAKLGHPGIAPGHILWGDADEAIVFELSQ